MIPSDGFEQKLDGVVDSVPPNKGCEVLDGELFMNNGMKIQWKL